MKATEEKDGTYTLSGLTYNQLTSITSGLWAVVDKQKAYSQKLKEVYKESIKETVEMVETLDLFMMEGLD
jgi:hypothetical protein